MSTYVCLLYVIHVRRATVHLYFINVPFSQITTLCLPITLSFMPTVRYVHLLHCPHAINIILRAYLITFHAYNSTLHVHYIITRTLTSLPFMPITLCPRNNPAHTYCLVHHAYPDCLLHYSAYVLYIKPRMCSTLHTSHFNGCLHYTAYLVNDYASIHITS
jgi:hypothetical protein